MFFRFSDDPPKANHCSLEDLPRTAKLQEVLRECRLRKKEEAIKKRSSKKTSLPRVRIFPTYRHLTVVWDADREEKRSRRRS